MRIKAAVDTAQPTRVLWPYMIVLSFIMLALFDAWIITQAIRTRVGTITNTPYDDALTYGTTVRARQAANDANITMELQLQGDILTAKFPNLSPSTDGPRKLELRLVRPDKPLLDRTLLSESSDRHFTFSADPLQKGLWIIQARVTEGKGDKSYYFETKESVR